MKRIYFLFIFLPIFALLSWSFQKEFNGYTEAIPDSGLAFDMVPIPEGTFTMGGKSGDEAPKHQVEISPFWMSSHEVTWDIFELFLDKNYEEAIAEKPLPENVDGLTRPSIPYLDMAFGMGKENKPAIGMTQYGAIQFCKWLYLKTGNFYRLPTEAEWEYAARAGTESTYFFGEEESLLDDFAWYAANSKGETQHVGTKKPNPWGLYDILGNVMEWTSDMYEAEVYATRNGVIIADPSVPHPKLYPTVIRGAHYNSPKEDLRLSKRFKSTPDWKRIDPQIPKSQWWFPEGPFLGIRLVRPLEPPTEEEILLYYDKAPIADY